MPRKNHHQNTKNNLNMKLRSDNKNVTEIIQIVKKLIKERKSFLSRQFHKNEISKENFELENSKLKELGVQIDSLSAKTKRLENDKILYQTENKELKEKLQRITNLYEDNKSDLERYYKVIQRTYSILQKAFSSNEIDISQLAGLCYEIRDVCDGNEVESNITTAENSPEKKVYNSFEEALKESEPKIQEIDTEQSFPSLVRSQCFYEKTNDQEDENTNNTYDQEFFSF
ncbi:hypothetical protein C2G38_2232088 [Gigaspora rosea]|uniref:Uncharacterized protein n=1 Tax=Gigaspora rosea TaxID=44941 RepID=A0A397TWB7_9GLOM|nr:hypothetical protein C2G38_2232088 [Gigaspora rosea]